MKITTRSAKITWPSTAGSDLYPLQVIFATQIATRWPNSGSAADPFTQLCIDFYQNHAIPIAMKLVHLIHNSKPARVPPALARTFLRAAWSQAGTVPSFRSTLRLFVGREPASPPQPARLCRRFLSKTAPQNTPPKLPPGASYVTGSFGCPFAIR